MPVFKYTDHIILWTLMSVQGRALIDMAHNRSENTAKFMIARNLLDYMGYDESTYPEFNSFVLDYAIHSKDIIFPMPIYEKDKNGESLYDKFSLAIRQEDESKIKQSCLAIARAELREGISWI